MFNQKQFFIILLIEKRKNLNFFTKSITRLKYNNYNNYNNFNKIIMTTNNINNLFEHDNLLEKNLNSLFKYFLSRKGIIFNYYLN